MLRRLAVQKRTVFGDAPYLKLSVDGYMPDLFIVGHEWPTYGAVEEGDSRVSPSLGAVYHSAVGGVLKCMLPQTNP